MVFTISQSMFSIFCPALQLKIHSAFFIALLRAGLPFYIIFCLFNLCFLFPWKKINKFEFIFLIRNIFFPQICLATLSCGCFGKRRRRKIYFMFWTPFYGCKGRSSNMIYDSIHFKAMKFGPYLLLHIGTVHNVCKTFK